MQCRDFREVADSYLSDELLVETNHDMIVHLEACAECRRELAARRELRNTLRASFAKAENLQITDQFAERVRRELRDAAIVEATPTPRSRAWMAIAACLLAAVAFALSVVWQREQVTEEIAAGNRPDPDVAQVKPADIQPPPATAVDADMVLARMSDLAAGDHRDCAINHRLPDRPIDLEEAARKYDPVFHNLSETVRSYLGDSNAEITLVGAHACVFKGRWFAHIVLRHRGRLASLLVTRLEQSEALPAKEKSKEADQHGQVIACATASGYQISCLRTAHHGIFVVSDLGEGENLALARGLAPSVYKHIKSAEDLA